MAQAGGALNNYIVNPMHSVLHKGSRPAREEVDGRVSSLPTTLGRPIYDYKSEASIQLADI